MAEAKEKHSPISRFFKKYAFILDDKKLAIKSHLAKKIPATRITINAWLADPCFYEKLESEKKGPRVKKRARFLELLEQYRIEEESKRTSFESADPLRQKEWRNRLSRWMRRFYVDKGLGHILWLPQGSEPVLLLVKPEWCPTKLTTLEAVDNPVHRTYTKGLRDANVPKVWPGLIETLNVRLGRKPSFNGFTYDLAAITAKDDLPAFEFCGGRFFDQVESGEALLWETAITASAHKSKIELADDSGWDKEKPYFTFTGMFPCRRKVDDPFDFHNRCVGVGINTLLVLAHDNKRSPLFLMHERGKHFFDPTDKSPSTEATNMWHVIPAGAWQPYEKDDTFHDEEFKFKENILREFAEEVLNKYDLMKHLYINCRPSDIYSVDHDKELAAVRNLFNTGGVSQWYLGCGLDLLTLKLEMLTLLIVNGDRLRDEVNRKLPDVNKEGLVHQYAFTLENLKLELNKPSLLPAGAGCLSLAIKHFDEIKTAAKNLVGSNPDNKRA